MKKTGEKELFTKIASERQPYCEVCGKHIGQWKVHNFSHILGKGAYPSLRLNPENIVIMCWDFGRGCHEKWDTGDREKLTGEWEKIFELADNLKQKYYA